MLSVCEASDFLKTPALQEEVFGPSSVVILCEDLPQMLAVTKELEGQFNCNRTYGTRRSCRSPCIINESGKEFGRILFNGFPTGVEVAHAMVHGGPFPSTSNSRSTSVGATAIDRFLRPVCYSGRFHLISCLRH